MSCDVERGTEWTDVISEPNWSLLLFSEKVLGGLKEIGASGFATSPVRIRAISSKRLRALPEPRYYYFDVMGRIDIDLEASGLGGVDRCPVCFRVLGGSHPEARRFTPLEQTWDSSDMFSMRNCPNSMFFCTRRVLELARRDRWTNCRFEPMDVVQRHATAWTGIDYLGPIWPPEWYPPRPSAGKSASEWLDDLRSDDHAVFLAAHTALWDLGGVAVPSLVRHLDYPSESVRKRAARVLGLIHLDEGSLPEEIRDKIRPLVSENLAKKLD